MVRDSLQKKVVQSQKQKQVAEPQSQPAGDATESFTADHQEPTQRQLDLLHWSKSNFEGEPGNWRQPLTGAEADALPTHLRPFSSEEEYKLVKSTYQQLKHSGYYWGPMTMEEAHEILTHASLGTFLIRDSGQPDVFFTLSYQSDEGPTSVRVQLNNLLFSLYGSQKSFASLFALLAYYTSSSCKLTVPYRRQRPERLKQMCRRALIHAHGVETISTLPRLSSQIKDYVQEYPHCI